MKRTLLISALIAIGFTLSGASHAAPQMVTKPDGSKVMANVEGNTLKLQAGKLWLPAGDGTYRTSDGKTIIVKGGIVGPSDSKGVIAPMFNPAVQSGNAAAPIGSEINAGAKMNAPLNVPTDISLPDDKKMYKPVPILKLSNSASGTQAPIRANAQIQTYDPLLSQLEKFKRTVALQKEASVAWWGPGGGRIGDGTACYEREYNRAEQAAGGCRETDTIASCYTKLAKACEAPYELRWNRANDASKSELEALERLLERYWRASR